MIASLVFALCVVFIIPAVEGILNNRARGRRRGGQDDNYCVSP